MIEHSSELRTSGREVKRSGRIICMLTQSISSSLSNSMCLYRHASVTVGEDLLTCNIEYVFRLIVTEIHCEKMEFGCSNPFDIFNQIGRL